MNKLKLQIKMLKSKMLIRIFLGVNTQELIHRKTRLVYTTLSHTESHIHKQIKKKHTNVAQIEREMYIYTHIYDSKLYYGGCIQATQQPTLIYVYNKHEFLSKLPTYSFFSIHIISFFFSFLLFIFIFSFFYFIRFVAFENNK